MAATKEFSSWLFLLLAVVFVAGYLRYIEKRSIFFPTKEIEYFPKESGLGFEDVLFKTSDNVELNGWFLPYQGARQTILFCHGNAGNISHRVEKLSFFNNIGCSVFIFDYRGYGKSKGSPSEKGFYRDAAGAYNYLLSRGINPQQIIGYGESIGGAVIIDLAYHNKLKGLIVDSVFSSVKDMVKIIYPFLPHWLLASRFDSVSKIKSVNTPKLIIHSINDEIVPYKLGRKIFDAAAQPKEFLQIHGGHNSCFYESENILREKIADFINKL